MPRIIGHIISISSRSRSRRFHQSRGHFGTVAIQRDGQRPKGSEKMATVKAGEEEEKA